MGIILLAQITGIMVAIPAASYAPKVGKVKMMYVAVFFMTVVLSGFVYIPLLPGWFFWLFIFIGAVFYGAGTGVFYAVDYSIFVS